MDIVHPRCCGLDVHAKTVTACVIVSATGSPSPCKEVRTFTTMPAELLALGDWLVTHAVTQVAMESTGVYWKPIWNVLEGNFALLLVNPQHVKAVPGRKTDVKDAEWLADLLRHGLIRGSFVPDQPQRELRELTRLRATRVQIRAAEVNRLLKTLESAGLKLGAVVTDITGVSARAILAAILGGQSDAAELAELARGRLRAKKDELEQALVVIPSAHHRFLITEHLALIAEMDEVITRLDDLIAERLAPVAAAVARLDTIPGVGRVVAEALLAEVGTDMSRFPSAKHLASWAGVCPGNHQSAGKRLSGKTRKGNRWLRTLLIEAAHAAGREKGTYLSAQYHRLVGRKGKQQAAMAVAHSILVRVYCLLRDGTTYHEPGGTWFDERDRIGTTRRLVRRLEHLGYKVIVEPLAAD
jgi:transposase